MTPPTPRTAAPGTAMRERTKEIIAEYWTVRESGQSEHVAVAQIAMALALSEADAQPQREGLREALDPDRLTAIIESRMSHQLAWLDDDGKTVSMLDPEQSGAALAHLYQTGDVVSGLPALAASPSATPPPHEPGDYHRYGHIECEVCGQRGMVNLSIEPQRAEAAYSEEGAG